MGRPSPEQSREKQEEVLRVARQEFIKNGYRAAHMSVIAANANVAKRTLYLWHADKSALFLACVLEGARSFPPLSVAADKDIGVALATYGASIARRFCEESSYGLGRLIAREARDFPELAAASIEAQQHYMVQPLATYLRYHGLEKPGSIDRTNILIAMMLVEVYAALLIGAPPPDPDRAERQARLAVEIFLGSKSSS